jgi:twitching motility protein PilT
MIPNSAIRNLIREDKIHQIYSTMQTGQEKFGMQTFNQALATLYFKKQISLQLALAMSSIPDELQDMINRGTGVPQSVQQRAMPGGAPAAAPARPGVAKR